MTAISILKFVSQRYSTKELSGKLIAKIILSIFFLFFGVELSLAVPACPGGAEVIQPDGTAITVFLRGDEHAHWNESKDGYLVTKDEKSRAWVYIIDEGGVALASGHVVGKADPKAIGASKPNKAKIAAEANSGRAQVLEAKASQPAFVPQTGTMYNLVVLVNFSDLTVAYPRQSYDDLFNQIGYTADGATGSVKDYYHEVSYNALTVQSTVVEPVTLDNGFAYYGGNNSSGDDLHPREMVQEALAKLEARGFDFSTVDGDGDGWVDGLTIIHAGGGEEYSGNDKDYIWSHQWATISTLTYDGVSMRNYHTEPARRGWDNSASTQGITRIGVICHENGHFLGLPDLYDYGYDSKGAGDFCLMAGGSWNGNYGAKPAHMSAWCKSDLGWVVPSVLSMGGVYSLSQVETNTQVYKLQGAFASTEYFLIENRQGTGFDAGLPGTQRGILIWHVDEARANNDDQTHYKVDLEEASGTQQLELNSSDGDDADYFRVGNATAFTGSSTPNNLSYAGQSLNLNVTDVSVSGESMSFTILAGLPGKAIAPSPANNASEFGLSSLLSFSAGAGAASHDVYFGTTSPGEFKGNQAGTIFDPGTLLPDTTYYWRIDEKNTTGTTTGDVWSFTTVALPWSDGFESGDFITGDWTIQNTNSTVETYTGSYGAKLRKTSWIEKIKSTEGYNTIHVRYRRATVGLSGEENLYVEWSVDGRSWNNLETVQNASYSDGLQDKVCDVGADNNANFRIRFRTDYATKSKYAYVDDIQIAATGSQTRVISGYVIEPDGETPVAGVVVDANGNGESSDITDANGFYEVAVAYNWSGTVKPIKDDYTFEPNIISYNNVIANDVNDYTATLMTFEISGHVRELDSNLAISDVNVFAENGGGQWTSRYGGGSCVTDANGYYNVVVDHNWSGKVTPAKYAYGFMPENMNYNNVVADHNDQDYAGKVLTFIISGYVKNQCNVPINGVLVDANNDGGHDVTDANGFYELWVGYNWTGTVSPALNDHTFEPNSIRYQNVLTDNAGQNYVANNIYDLDCDGSIWFGDLAIVLQNWLQAGPDVAGNFNRDEVLDFLDFTLIAQRWLEGVGAFVAEP